MPHLRTYWLLHTYFPHTYLPQSGEYRLRRRHHPRIGRVAVLQGNQIRRFGIDVDAGATAKVSPAGPAFS